MCGIYGYIGKGAVREVTEALKRLEYRGYDSAGIAFMEKGSDFIGERVESENVFVFNSGLTAIKEKGYVCQLESLASGYGENSKLAIGHTRWATHGKPSVENCHPHISSDGKWAVVHNGIIENYALLKGELEGYKFKSETDSEVVVALLERLFDGCPLGTLHKVCNKLKGSWALGVVYSEEPNKIYVARQNSPLVVGYGKDFGLICSDINSTGRTDARFVLDNGQFAVVERGNVQVFDENLKKVRMQSVKVEENVGSALGEYQHFMLKEIDEIPSAIQRTATAYNSVDKFERALPKEIIKSMKEVLIIGCGTAYHASLMGGEILERECSLRTSVQISSEFLNKAFLYNKDTLAVFVSQSGETADTLKALKRCKENGLKTLAITNVKNSSICQEADYVLYTSAGSEVAVASTKAFNAQLTLFHMLSAYFNAVLFGNDGVLEECEKLCKVAEVIKKNNIKPLCQSVAEKIKGSSNIYMIGRGDDYRTALEASLKLKEISYIHCEAYPAGELKHGTISLVTPETFVFAFVTGEETRAKSMANISEVASRGGKVILLTRFDDTQSSLVGGGTELVVGLPKLKEKYSPLVAIVYMQLIAYYTSLALRLNPDKPRSLAKSVTVE